MIPVMIVFGMVFGWWWRSALVAGAVVWPLLLWRIGIYDEAQYAVGGALGMTVGAAVLGAANTGVGVGINRGIQAFARRSWRRPTPAAPDPDPTTPS